MFLHSDHSQHNFDDRSFNDGAQILKNLSKSVIPTGGEMESDLSNLQETAGMHSPQMRWLQVASMQP